MKRGIETLKDELEKAVKNNILECFVYLVELSKLRYPEDYDNMVLSLLEMIVTKPDRELFVYECLARAACHDKDNADGEYAIHIVAKSRQVKYLEKLLSIHPTIVDQMTRDNKTALQLLSEQIDIQTFESTVACVSLLLTYNASVPETCLAGSVGSTEIERFLKALLERVDKQCTSIFYRHVTNDQWMLRNFIVKQSRSLEETIPAVIENVQTGILSVCCKTGNYRMLAYMFQILSAEKQKQMLEKKRSNRSFEEENLLMVLIHRVNESDSECPFFKCLKLCVSNPLVDVDETDGRERRALDYAAKYKQKRVQKLLLERGAYLGGRDTFGRYVLCKVDPIVLKQHLDSCIYTTSEGYKGREANDHIIVMLNNFIPPTYKTNQWRRKLVSSNESKANESNKNVLPALIEFIDSSEQLPASDINKETRLQIVEHPVIHALLYIRDPPSKWYIRAVRVLPLLMLLVGCFDPSAWTYGWFVYLKIFVLSILFMFEVIQHLSCIFVSSPKKETWKEKIVLKMSEVKNQLNAFWLVECILFVMVFVYAINGEINPRNGSLITCLAVLAGIAMKRCITSYSKYETSIHMLVIVYRRILKYLPVFGFLFVILAIVLLANDLDNGITVPLPNDNNTSAQAGNFTSIALKSPAFWSKMFQTVTFFAGELNTADMQFSTWFNSFIVLLFIFVLPVGLANLLIAIAVGDVSDINKQSRRLKIRFKASRLYHHEGIGQLMKLVASRGVQTPLNSKNNVLYIEMEMEHNNQINLYELQDKSKSLPKLNIVDEVPKSSSTPNADTVAATLAQENGSRSPQPVVQDDQKIEAATPPLQKDDSRSHNDLHTESAELSASSSTPRQIDSNADTVAATLPQEDVSRPFVQDDQNIEAADPPESSSAPVFIDLEDSTTEDVDLSRSGIIILIDSNAEVAEALPQEDGSRSPQPVVQDDQNIEAATPLLQKDDSRSNNDLNTESTELPATSSTPRQIDTNADTVAATLPQEDVSRSPQTGIQNVCPMQEAAVLREPTELPHMVFSPSDYVKISPKKKTSKKFANLLENHILTYRTS